MESWQRLEFYIEFILLNINNKQRTLLFTHLIPSQISCLHLLKMAALTADIVDNIDAWYFSAITRDEKKILFCIGILKFQKSIFHFSNYCAGSSVLNFKLEAEPERISVFLSRSFLLIESYTRLQCSLNRCSLCSV